MKTLCSCGKVIEKGSKCTYCANRKKLEVILRNPIILFKVEKVGK